MPLFCPLKTFLHDHHMLSGMQVEAGLRQIGYNSTASPYWVHGVMAAFLSALPTGLVNWQLMSMHKGLRQRWQKKQERAKKQ